MEYKIVRAKPYDIEHSVKSYLERGWEPLGGVSVVALNAQVVMCFQAIVKKD